MRTATCFLLITLSSLLSWSTPAIAQSSVNLVTNGSFESASINPGASFITLNAGDTAITGWTVIGANIDYIGAYWNASNGTRSLDLDGYGAAGGVQQTFRTTPGSQYAVTFDLAGNFVCGPRIKAMLVSAAGQSTVSTFDSFGHSSTNMGWITRNWSFTANDSSTTLQFVSLTGSGCGPALDNVAVSIIPINYIFPLVADGRLPDGSFFTTSVVLYGNEAAATCNVSFLSMGAPVVTLRDGTTRTGSSLTIQLNRYGWEVLRSSGSQPLTTGYATISCQQKVDAQILYTFYDALGRKVSEAPVFPLEANNAARIVQTVIDQRRGERLGIAVTNASDNVANLRLVVFDAAGIVVSQTLFTVNARTVIPRFVDELVPTGLPGNFIGKIVISSDDLLGASTFYAVALSFTGGIFTTIPVTRCDSGASFPRCTETR